MLEIRDYSRDDIFSVLHVKSRSELKRKLNTYNVSFDITGRGKNMVVSILNITNPFKVYCITELGIDASTDFIKLRNFYYYFFNGDDNFMSMPDEVKEARMRSMDVSVTRQSIAKYERHLSRNEFVAYSQSEYIYYFAYKQNQIMTDSETYKKAWREYFDNKNSGMDSTEAIWNMKVEYGGVARKQAIIEANAIYESEINFFNQLIVESWYRDLEKFE